MMYFVLTPMYAKMTHIQISSDRGVINEKTPGDDFSGFKIMILIPRPMKGLEKSITSSRSAVIVRGAMARSAS